MTFVIPFDSKQHEEKFSSMVRMIVGATVASMMTVLAAPALGQDQPLTPPPVGATTLQQAIGANRRSPTPAPANSGRNMKAIPIGSPADWFSPDDYPGEALRASRTGRVVVAVGVDSTGAVVTCRVLTSSGTDILDRRTCDLAKEHGRFNPATDRKGRPVASEYPLPVRWAMPDDYGSPTIDIAESDQAERSIATEATFAPDGTLLSCRVLSASGKGMADACKNAKIGDKGPVHWLRNGEPTGVKVIQRVSIHVEPAS